MSRARVVSIENEKAASVELAIHVSYDDCHNVQRHHEQCRVVSIQLYDGSINNSKISSSDDNSTRWRAATVATWNPASR